jgi:manganese/zinc/iron transport system permease protein
LVAAACAIPGVFLVLRRQSLMSDAISHSILFGIVIALFLTHEISSPWLIIGATLTGVATVSLTELIINTRLLKEDSAIGLIFPMFFAIAVLLINKYAGDIHIDSDAVLLGSIDFAPENRFVFNSLDYGPKAMWVMGAILLANCILLMIFYKELKLATFDAGLAAALGLLPGVIHYGLMTMVSITAVGAFDAVGSILVVALMITPPATALMLTNRLHYMILLSIGIGMMSAITGCVVAHSVGDISTAGAMTSASGFFFLLAVLFAPKKGMVSKAVRAHQNRWTFACHLLTIHLLDHEGTPQESDENTFSNLVGPHMKWEPPYANKIVNLSEKDGLITRHGNHLNLTPLGRETARAIMNT